MKKQGCRADRVKWEDRVKWKVGGDRTNPDYVMTPLLSKI